MGRNVYLDLGANDGLTIRRFCNDHPGFFVFAFEPAPKLAEKLRKDFCGPGSGIHIMEYAVWIVDGQLDFYLGSANDVSSTLLKGKKASPEWAVDYALPTRVRSLDFGRWFDENTSKNDNIIIKMDIEGSEYRVLRRMMDLNLVERVSELRVEWHFDRYPEEISRAEHDQMRNALKQITHLVDWA
jgi:FkbM family methyltransferase